MIIYEVAGAEHTEETCKIAIEKAMAMNTDIVASSTKGDSGIAICKMAKELGFNGKIIIVTHSWGFKEPGQNEMSTENRKVIEGYGAAVLSTTHLLSGAERAISGKFEGAYPVEMIAHTLRMFCQGVKVLPEISGMALDSGLIEYGKEIVCVAGTGSGLDTAAVITPAHGNHIFETTFNELLCMPRQQR